MSALAASRIAVGIGQLAVSKDKADVLVAYGLGSCVGVSAFDPVASVAGLIHILLPATERNVPNPKEPARYADSAIDVLVERMCGAGASKNRLIVKIVGGASVLGAANAEKFKIGDKNAEAVRENLRRNGLRVIAADTGGNRGRTMEVYVADGRTTVRTAAQAAREL